MPIQDFTDINQLLVNGVSLVLALLSLALMAKLAQPFLHRLAMSKLRRIPEAR